MNPNDYINSWTEMNKEFKETKLPFHLSIPTNDEVVQWLDEKDDNLTLAIRHLEQAAQLLGGEISHYTCIDSKLNKCQKYAITYDRE